MPPDLVCFKPFGFRRQKDMESDWSEETQGSVLFHLQLMESLCRSPSSSGGRVAQWVWGCCADEHFTVVDTLRWVCPLGIYAWKTTDKMEPLCSPSLLLQCLHK